MTEQNEQLIEVCEKVKLIPNVVPEICGSWLWVSGDTRPQKDKLKQAGLRWARKKQQWYWRPDGYRKKGKRILTIDEIRQLYGSEAI